MLAFGLVIANAFNGMPWTAITSALLRHRVPDCLAAMIRDYLSAAICPAGVGAGPDPVGLSVRRGATRRTPGRIVGAIERQGFRVSPEKTQAIWFHNGRKKRAIPHARGKIGGKVKYLVLVLDGRWTFEDHFEERTPACRGRITTGYRTLTHEAAAVLVGLPPMDLQELAAARTNGLLRRYRVGNPGPGSEELEEIEEKMREIRRSVMKRWHCRLRRPDSARHRAVGPIVLVLSGHGCFGEHLHMIRKEVTPGCWHCGAEVDTAQHNLVDCPAWMP
ncbi:uncharacterized protein LOC143221454, partial [Lasioglossum baleicum]|uniref:uncharacterized protein LOC143221454 n=1 Tax=Lasioglossum baleicum TaxID=434251 RepID=UPI003FCD8D56